MQVTINILDDLPSNIVQQTINRMAIQLALIGKLIDEKQQNKNTVSLARGSAKQQIIFIADFKGYMY